MTTYKGINGFAVQSVATDPSPLDEGQVWYNNATYAFKLAGIQVAAWASGGNLPTAKTYGGGTGIQTAALYVAGTTGPGFPSFTNSMQSYDGTSWTSAPNYPVAIVGNAAIGTQTAALGAGGYQQGGSFPTATHSYNGSSWSTVPATLNDIGQNMIQFGVQTAAIITAIQFDNPATNSWNGSSWTTLPATTNTSHQDGGIGFGTQTAAIIAYGGSPLTSQSESWNGSTWTTGPSVNTARQELGGSQNSPQTSGLAFGGKNPTTIATTESWNGTAWASAPNLATARYQVRGNAGSSGGSALAAGGNTFPGAQQVTNTEEFTGATVATKTITTS